MVGNLQDLLRRRVVQRLLRVAAHLRRPRAAVPRLPDDHRGPPARRGARPHVAAAFVLWRQATRRAPGPLRHQEVGAAELRVAHHALGRRDHRAVHRLPPPRPDVRGRRTPTARTARPTTGWSPSFQNPIATAFYVVALVLLGMHLRHGLWSATQTLGQSNRRRERTVNAAATAFRGPPHRRLPRRPLRRPLRPRRTKDRNAARHASRTLHRRRPDRRHQGPHRRPDRRAVEQPPVPRHAWSTRPTAAR